MDDYSTDTFANQEPPPPLLTVTYDDVDTDDSDSSRVSRGSRRSRIKRSIPGTRLKEKAQGLHAATSERISQSPSGKPSLQDRLFNKLLEQVIPTEELEDAERESKIDRRSSEYVSRPAFSLGTMSNNFRRFNARIGIVFVFQNRMIRLFTWKTTTHTVSFLAAYTFVCLDPYLLIVLPLAVALLFIMVPAFIARHPPPPQPTTSHTKADLVTNYSYSGPPIAPARTIKPAAETSKDFFRNMRDLQNSMADFSNLHDTLVQYVAPATNFSDEVFSSLVFVYLSILTTALFISAHLLPFRAISLLGGWALIISCHPVVQVWLIKQHKKIERKAAEYSDQLKDPRISKDVKPNLYGLPIPNNATTRTIQSTITSMSEITLSSAPETAEVEVFELQHRPLLPIGSTLSRTASALEWQTHLYTPNPYDPLSPNRISGSRPKGSRFFEDVQPPEGWQWHTPKWELDLEVGEWVSDRLIVGVEYDVINYSTLNAVDRRESINADFGGWAWDLAPPSSDTKSGLERQDEVWLAYGDYHVDDDKDKEKKKLREHNRHRSSQTQKDWEEQIKFGSRGRTGEWRRRRWVRLVRRRPMPSHTEH